MSDVAVAVEQGAPRRSADAVMCRLLCVPQAGGSVSEAAAQRLFSGSILLSATRCLLSYVVLPILTPLLGVAASVGPWVGLPLGIVALFFDVRGVRRFWLANHRLRWQISGIYLLVMALVVTLVVGDVVRLVH
jgi:hypothetical protein